jgi:hypothetical protein
VQAMPLIFNSNCKNGALFYYFLVEVVFFCVPGPDWETKRKWGKKQKQKAISVVRPTLLYLLTVALRC